MFKNISIKNKLIAIQTATALIAVLICCVVFVINDIRIFKDSSIKNQYSIAQIVGENSVAPLIFHDQEAANKILMNLNSNPSILNSGIFDRNGSLFAMYNKTNESLFSFSEAGSTQSTFFEGQYLIVNYKVFQGNDFLGTVWIRSELMGLNSIVLNYIKVAVFVLFIAIIATFIISIFFQKIITNPLFAFVNKTREVSEKGDYSVRVSYAGMDEIGELAKGFNNMLEQIQKMEATLRENNFDLERRVKSRTIELETANRELVGKSEELARSNLDLEQFAYIASHDLQEPLRTISNFVGLFKKHFNESNSDKEFSRYLDYITGATERMQALIVDLLSYSRIGHYKDLQDVDCNTVVKEVISDFETVIREGEAKIDVEDLPVIKGHHSEIKSLFQNLISNAIKFRKKNQPAIINIGASERVNDWLFWVKDNGIGIDSTFHDKMFKIFQRLHPQNEYSGTGIGLAQCKKIVELLGGKIWVESKPEEGSIFYFNIPK